MNSIDLAESGWVPDVAIRAGIRQLLRRRLAQSVSPRADEVADSNHRFRASLRGGPVALVPELANEQHYEVAPEFFERVLGRHLKYSCGLFDDGAPRADRADELDRAEERMLALSVQRAQIEEGMSILDLGCGWGSLSLYLAERFPGSRILAVSNSKLQREFILGCCRQRGLRNVEVVTADVNRFEPDRSFDRVMSVEMFEHVRNHELLLARIARWLEPGGSLFVHHFSHRSTSYAFEDDDSDDWMARHFFSGGLMPSHDWLLHFQNDLVVDHQWVVDGNHYAKTADAWLAKQDADKDATLHILGQVYGPSEARVWFQRWRLFFMACSELFGYRDGQEWCVTHTRMQLPQASR
jgi:cyclopropane-fatty-acyl-phospholipid synthase